MTQPPLFSVEDRESLRGQLISAARADDRIAAAALVGSAAVDREDRWSDIDLALSIAAGADRQQVIDEWTDRMYAEHTALDHLDVPRGSVLYRVFLLASTLQVDLSFWPAEEFRATGPSFRVLFGSASRQSAPTGPVASELIGMGWLYALHARSSIARGKPWQAEYMISMVRDHVFALACLREGLPAVEGRGMDDLPGQTQSAVERALVRSLDVPELSRALREAIDALLAEIEAVDAELGQRLKPALAQMYPAST
jgi:predicted nucleotidyltransferase